MVIDSCVEITILTRKRMEQDQRHPRGLSLKSGDRGVWTIDGERES